MTPAAEPEAGSSAHIYEQLRGLIVSGYLGSGERLPTVRQTAADFAVSPGTAARAFKLLEQNGLIETRKGGGTRVAAEASPLPAPVVAKLRELVRVAQAHGASLEDVQTSTQAVWQAGS